MTVLFQDPITRADSANLGSDYVQLKGEAGRLGVVSNQVDVGTAATDCGDAIDAGISWPNDHWIEADCVLVASGEWLLWVRGEAVSGSTKNGYQVGCDNGNEGDNLNVILKRVNDTWTELVHSATQDVTAGVRARGEVLGTTISLKVGGVTKASTTDASHSAGKPGMSAIHSAGNVALFDNIEAGDFVDLPNTGFGGGGFAAWGEVPWAAGPAAVGGGATVSPGTGQATWDGFAPTVQTPVAVSPGLGDATWTGFAPAVTIGVNVLPGAGAATWDGFAPTVQTPRNVTPGVGDATWAGFAPTANVGVNVQLGVGAATWDGFAPTIQTPKNVTPGVGAATWTGLAPTVQTPRNVTTGIGDASWTGFAPTVSVSNHVVVRPATGEAQWQGFAPTVQGSVIAQQESGSGGKAKRARARVQLLRGGLPVPTLRFARLSVVNPVRAFFRRGALDFGIGLRRGRINHSSVLLGELVPQASYHGAVSFAPTVREGRVIALAPLELDEMLEILGIYELTDG